LEWKPYPSDVIETIKPIIGSHPSDLVQRNRTKEINVIGIDGIEILGSHIRSWVRLIIAVLDSRKPAVIDARKPQPQ
jgi:hypothetical protein